MGKLDVGSWKLEVGSWKSEVGSWKSEVGSRKLEVGSWKLEVGSGGKRERVERSPLAGADYFNGLVAGSRIGFGGLASLHSLTLAATLSILRNFRQQHHRYVGKKLLLPAHHFRQGKQMPVVARIGKPRERLCDNRFIYLDLRLSVDIRGHLC